MSIGLCIATTNGAIIASDGMVSRTTTICDDKKEETTGSWKSTYKKLFKLSDYCGGVFWGAADLAATIIEDFLKEQKVKSGDNNNIVTDFSAFANKRSESFFIDGDSKIKLFVGYLISTYNRDQNKIEIAGLVSYTKFSPTYLGAKYEIVGFDRIARYIITKFHREDLSISAALDLAYYALCENIKLNPMVGEPIQLAYIDRKGYTELESEELQRFPEKIKSIEETQSSLFR
jgi:20S proteasome alpha/beta subunit